MNEGKKYRLLVFHQALAPYRMDFWNHLSRDFDADIYFIYENLIEQKFNQDKLREHLGFEPRYLKHGFRIGDRAFKWGFLPIIRKTNPEVVFTYEYSQTTLFLYLIRKFFSFNYRIYSVCDDSMHLAKSRKGLRESVRKFLITRIDGLIVLNQEVANWYKASYKLKNDPVFFPIVAEDHRFRAALTESVPVSQAYIEQHQLQNRKVLLFVGRLVGIKGLDRVIQAFALIAQKHPDASLIIIGDGPESSRLQELTASISLQDQVLFPGRFEGIPLLAWYNVGQIFVLGSHSEAFGAVINESMLAGEYVLCSRYAGATELVRENLNGNIFDPFDIQQLSEQMHQRLAKVSPIASIGHIRPSGMPVTFLEYYGNFRDHLISQIRMTT
jgi:glycosyltransferase involved in cell wall biosynthesis